MENCKLSFRNLDTGEGGGSCLIYEMNVRKNHRANKPTIAVLNTEIE